MDKKTYEERKAKKEDKERKKTSVKMINMIEQRILIRAHRVNCCGKMAQVKVISGD